jgi:hypothetical protein
MAGLKDDAQWIVLMGFIVSFSLFFIAIVLNQSTVVGQTTAEAVLEFPKHDIRGVRDVVIQTYYMDDTAPFKNKTNVQKDIQTIALSRQNAVVSFSNTTSEGFTYGELHYNNGVVVYNEDWRSP